MDSENSSVEKRSGSADLTDVHGPEKRHLDVDTTNVDVAAGLTAGKDFVLDPADLTRVVAVLDWEMAGVGPGVLDLASLTAGWGGAPIDGYPQPGETQ